MAMTVHVGMHHAEKFVKGGQIVNPDELNQRIDDRFAENPPQFLLPEHLLPEELDAAYLLPNRLSQEELNNVYLKKSDYGSVLAPLPTGGDDTTMLNTFLANNIGKTVILRNGLTYKVNNTFNVFSGVKLDGNGATIDATGIPDGSTILQKFGIKSEGTLGNSQLIGAPIAKWSKVITSIASTAGLVAGDLVRIRNFENCAPGGTRSDRSKGELNIIQSVDSATQVTLVAGTILDYGNDGNLVIAKVTPVKNVVLKNFTLIMGGIGSAHTGIRFTYAKDIAVENVTVIGGEDNGISLSHVYNGTVSKCTINGSTSPAPAVGNTGYGVAVVEASRYVWVRDNYFEDCRVFVDGGGYWPTAFVYVTGNQGQKSSNKAYACHEPCFYWTISGNTANNVAGGILVRGQWVTVEYNLITNSSTSGIRYYTDDGVNVQEGIVVRHNVLRKTFGGIEIDGKAGTGVTVDSIKRDVVVAYNDVIDCTFDAFLMRNFDKALVAGNTVKNVVTGNAFNISGLSAVLPSSNLVLNANSADTIAFNGAKITWVNDISLAGGSYKNLTERGLLIDTCFRSSLTAINIRRAVLNGIRIINGGQHILTGSQVTDIYGTNADAVVAVTSNDLIVSTSQLTGARYGLYSSGCDRIIVTSNNAAASGNATKFYVETNTTRQLANNIGAANVVSA